MQISILSLQCVKANLIKSKTIKISLIPWSLRDSKLSSLFVSKAVSHVLWARFTRPWNIDPVLYSRSRSIARKIFIANVLLQEANSSIYLRTFFLAFRIYGQ